MGNNNRTERITTAAASKISETFRIVFERMKSSPEVADLESGSGRSSAALP
jgi:hypothetical protein